MACGEVGESVRSVLPLLTLAGPRNDFDGVKHCVVHPELYFGTRRYGDRVMSIVYDGSATYGCLDVMSNLGGACTGMVETHC